jgi:hypothetical protein
MAAAAAVRGPLEVMEQALLDQELVALVHLLLFQVHL